VTIEAEALRVFAPAKINLFLHVGGKRADGFHDLESLVAFADVGDALAFSNADGLSLSVEGPFASALGNDGDNLVLRAARALAAHAGISLGARITLTKNLPVASGIGGGSADAAATLRGLAKLWNLSIAQETLHAIAAMLGSDVPVCLDCAPAWMEGRGERVTAVSTLPPVAMVLVNPGVAVATAQVFRTLEKRHGVGLTPPPQFADARALVRYLETTHNDLEAPALALAPIIGDVLKTLSSLPGVLFSRMSGSGATCFALFAETAAARMVAADLSRRRSDWWVAAT
jgi:4-diphosphocytidyl-2-C-methyl-D-erythritol kinase